MSRSRRGTGDPLSPAHKTKPGAEAHAPRAPRVRKFTPKVQTDALTKLQGAAARSRTRTPSEADDDAEFESNTLQAIAQATAQRDDRQDQLTLDGPTESQALEFAKLLRAGVPQPDALCYVLGAVEPGIIELALPRWMRSRLVVDALATLNGGRWPALDHDARLDIALDKHYAEMAHYLYTHDYDSADGPTLRKLDAARTSLESLRTGRMQENSPFVKFLRSILAPKSTPAPMLGLPEATSDGYRAPTLGLVEIVEGEVTEADEGE